MKRLLSHRRFRTRVNAYSVRPVSPLVALINRYTTYGGLR